MHGIYFGTQTADQSTPCYVIQKEKAPLEILAFLEGNFESTSQLTTTIIPSENGATANGATLVAQIAQENDAEASVI